jgi:hypothetical protein
MINEDISKIIGSFRQQIIVGGLDITEWVISVNVSRSIEQPTGKWTLTLRPIIGDDNLMLRLPVDLNDLVEIRIDRAHEGEVKVVMRGLLDAEDMSEKPSGGMDGSPNRSYLLSGSDLGKVLERRQVFYPPDSSDRSRDEQMNTLFLLKNDIIRYADTLPGGTQAGQQEGDIVVPLSSWVKYFVSVVYSTELAQKFSQSRGSQFANFSFSINDDLPQVADGVERFNVSTFTVNNITGSYWQFIKYYCIQPFIETFFEDNNDSTVFNVRWTPLRMREAQGQGYNYFFPSQRSNNQPWRRQPIKKITLRTFDILEKQIRRQDTDRCTYFFVSLNAFGDGSSQNIQFDEGDGGNSVGDNPYWDRNGIDQFGIRPMVIEIPWMNTVWQNASYAESYDPDSGAGNRAAAEAAATKDIHPEGYTLDIKHILNDLNAWLVTTMTYIDQLYTGVLVIVGNSNVTVGCEIFVEDSQEQYYVESVEHAWQVFPAPQFITRLGVSRGTVLKSFTASEKNRFVRIGATGVRATLGILAEAGGDAETTKVVDDPKQSAWYAQSTGQI